VKIACPWLAFVLVEARERKCAFLRAVTRELDISDVQVECCRFEDLRKRRPDLAGTVGVVTFRAVRADTGLWAPVEWLLSPSGRVFWFGGQSLDVPLWLEARHSFDVGLVLGRRGG
jgi:16S rRNA G527 N7-methylase RsmG